MSFMQTCVLNGWVESQPVELDPGFAIVTKWVLGSTLYIPKGSVMRWTDLFVNLACLCDDSRSIAHIWLVQPLYPNTLLKKKENIKTTFPHMAQVCVRHKNCNWHVGLCHRG